jgi:thioredoxin reductase
MQLAFSLLLFMKILLSLHLTSFSLLTIIIVIMHPTTAALASQPKIAIIGGGAAGLAAARVFSRQGLTPVVLEKDEIVGGVWRRIPASKSRPMYKGLRTNLPKEIMAFREYPFSSTIESSFVTHEQVHAYLQDYARKFHIEQYIQKNCRVEQVTAMKEQAATGLVNSDWKTIKIDWTRTNVHDQQKESCSGVFDALCIANGHYSLPAIPTIDGMQHFTGRVLHSIEYDEPHEFANQTVLCVGGRASGSDLAREIALHAKHVYLSDPKAPLTPMTQYNVTWLPKTTQVLPDGSICFHGCTDSVRIDTIIFCTGYEYQFPFINADSNLELTLGGRRVAPLLEQLWHALAPNVAFLGLPHSVVPFPLFELQAEALSNQWLRKWTLPKDEELVQQAWLAANSGGEGKENGRIPEDTHYLGDAQWNYCRRMAEYADVYDDGMEDYLMTNKVRISCKSGSCRARVHSEVRR